MITGNYSRRNQTMNKEIDDKIIELLKRLTTEDLEYISSSLTFNTVTPIVNKWIQLHDALETHNYIAASMEPSTLEIYWKMYMDKALTNDVIFRTLGNHYFNIRNARQRLMKRFPNYPDTKTISLNFDGVIRRRDVALEGQRKARERRKKK